MGHTLKRWGPAFKFTILRLIGIFATIIVSILFTCQAVQADSPSCISHQYLGTVKHNGVPVGQGYTVYALVNGEQVASTTTDSNGQWGYTEPFIVSAPSGSFVEFYVSGEYQGKAASCIAGPSTKLDFTVSVLTAPNTSNATANTGTTITANILGRADSLPLNNGLLAVAKKLSSADGRISLSFSVNAAVTTNGATLITLGAQASPPVPPPGVKLIQAYGFSPDNFTVSPAASVTLKYDSASLPSQVDESNLYIAQWNGVTWIPLSSTVNTIAKTVAAQLKSLSTIAILGKVNPPRPPQVISTFILGKADNITVNNGILTAARDLESSDGKIRLDFVDNTTLNLNGGQQITVLQMASPPASPAGSGVIAAYSFGPDNSSFNPPLTLTIKYDTSEIQRDMTESGLYIAAFTPSENWTPLLSTVDTLNKKVTCQITHFSVYALLGEEIAAELPATAAFTTSDLTIIPQTSNAGGTITISARLVNNDAIEATHEVVLKVNDTEEARKKVTLPGGGSQTVSFTLTRNEPGIYAAAIDNLTASFSVKAVALQKDQATQSGFPILAAIAFCALLVVIFVLVQIVKQRSRY
ncbi:MAG: hypothetical protein ABSF74_04850 [Dehalococcoidia bacterium]|jgi:hypothetical protein